MENINIETIHNVQINYKLAGVGPRLLSAMIDISLKAIFLIGSAVLSALLDSDFRTYFVIFISIIITFYDLLMETFFHGQTLGKMALRIKVVKVDGSSPTFSAYILRWLFTIVDLYISFGAVAVISIIFTKNSQRLGDLAANTTVIRTDSNEDFAPIFHTYHLDEQITHQEVVNLSDEDIYLAIDLVKAYSESEGSEKIYTAIELAGAKFKDKMGIKSEEPPLIFLKTIIKDYHNKL